MAAAAVWLVAAAVDAVAVVAAAAEQARWLRLKVCPVVLETGRLKDSCQTGSVQRTGSLRTRTGQALYNPVLGAASEAGDLRPPTPAPEERRPLQGWLLYCLAVENPQHPRVVRSHWE